MDSLSLTAAGRNIPPIVNIVGTSVSRPRSPLDLSLLDAARLAMRGAPHGARSAMLVWHGERYQVWDAGRRRIGAMRVNTRRCPG